MMEEKQNQFCVQDQKPFFVFCKDLFRNPMTGIDDDDQLVDVVSFFIKFQFQHFTICLFS